MYHSFPCLWQIKCKDYSNKKLKNEAYDKLLELCRSVVDNPTREFVIKKINALRGAFRKELKKVQMSHSGMDEEEKYKPQLWYFNLLMFTTDQEESRQGKDSLDTNLDELDYAENSIELLTEELPSTQQEESNTQQIEPPKKCRKRPNKTEQLLEKAKQVLETTTDEYDALGIMVAAKLRKMDEKQRLFAENLINRALYAGTLGKLTEESEIRPLLQLQPFQSSIPSAQTSRSNFSNCFIPIHAPPGVNNFRINTILSEQAGPSGNYSLTEL
ncbi:hypothetical protein FQR65_LT16596 [Abscondita terminalis]|nr:hypothetical protein FQR65_LT16596 [Abscondita terminalis]